MPDDFERRRVPAVPRAVAKIKPDDIRVRVLGTVLDVSGTQLVLDDGTGKVTVSFRDPPKAKPNQLVRVFGRVIPGEKEVELSGEILQDATGLNLDLHRRILALQER